MDGFVITRWATRNLCQERLWRDDCLPWLRDQPDKEGAFVGVDDEGAA